MTRRRNARCLTSEQVHIPQDGRICAALTRDGVENNRFFTESLGSKQGLRRSPKSCTRKEHESATNPIAKRGQGAIAPCRVKGQRPLWGLGQRPNCPSSDQSQGSRQQRCRQRSVPASNFARPQTRPKLLPSQASVKNQIIRLSEQIGNGIKSCHFFLRALRPGVFIYEKSRKMIAKYGKNT